jgi:formylglycine-generating enzyme required for sulfatase activity
MSRIMNVHEFPSDVSPFGVRGMAGNASDWCLDYGERGTRQLRIVRGGNSSSAEPEARLARVQLRRPDDVGPLVGFRIRATVRTIEMPSSRARDFARARD